MIAYATVVPTVEGTVVSDIEHTNTILHVNNTSFLCISTTHHVLTGEGVHVTYLVITENVHLDLLLMSLSHDYQNKDVYVYVTNDIMSATFARYNYRVIEIESTKNSDIIVYKRGRIR